MDEKKEVKEDETGWAFDILKSKDEKGWDMIRVDYNLTTGFAEITSRTYLSDSIAVAQYKIKEILIRQKFQMVKPSQV